MIEKTSSEMIPSPKRRVALGHIAGALASAFLPAVLPAHGADTYTEGADFERLPSALPKEAPGKIEVMEFFAYWCPHCNAFDPVLNEWSKRQAGDVVLLHTPWAYQDSQVPLQRLYYALEALGKEGELRARVFSAIHIDHNPLSTIDQQAEWAAKNGIDAKKYRDTYESFSVETKTRRATQIAQSAGISAVPTVVVNGKYVIGSRNNTLMVADFLVGEERKLVAKKA